MRLIEIMSIVWINLIENKLKLLLPSLGIIVGAATIVLVIAIGKGGQADVADQFKNLNAGAIDVKVTTSQAAGMNGMGGMPDFSAMMPNIGGAMSPPTGGSMPNMGGGSTQRGGSSSSTRNNTRMPTVRLDTKDVEDISELVSELEEATILINGDKSVYGGNLEDSITSTIVGVQENYQRVSNLNVLYGDFITSSDEENGNYVAVIGYSLAEKIFTYPYYALGDYVTIESKNYRIVGVLSEMGAVSSGISTDDAIYIPYSVGQKYVFGSSTQPTITAIASDVSLVESAISNIEIVLKEYHPNGYFAISDAGSALPAATSSANTLAMLLFAVATIVFVVGGIGFLKVLLGSVNVIPSVIGFLMAVGFP